MQQYSVKNIIHGRISNLIWSLEAYRQEPNPIWPHSFVWDRHLFGPTLNAGEQLWHSVTFRD